MLHADGELSEQLRRIRQEFVRPIHFIRGNHGDFARLQHLPINAITRTASADPIGTIINSRCPTQAPVQTALGLRKTGKPTPK